jgi:hypothetical protein
MKFTAKRLLTAGAIGISAIVTPIALTVALPGASNLPSTVAGAQGPFDEITYNQYATGSPLDTDQYVPAAGGGPAAQALNVSGNCATPTATPPPGAALTICGQLWPLGFTGAPSLANLGTNPSQGPATGVGAISPAWTIDTKANKGAEAIDFSPGDSSIIGQDRAFTDAQIPVARKDTGNSGIGQVVVQLAEFSSTLPAQPSAGTLIATQDCTINGNTGTQITADPKNCTASLPDGHGSFVPTPSSFGTIEVRDATAGSTSIAVVGQTATFELVSVICGGNHVPAQDNSNPPGSGPSATLTLPAGAGCKSFTSFSATTPGGVPTLTFNGFSTSPVQFTVKVTWPKQARCQPYSDPQSAANPTGIPPDLTVPVCAPHQVTFDNVHFFDQTYCGHAVAPPPGPPPVEPQAGLCTANKQYNNDSVTVDPNNPDVVTSTTELMMPDNTPATQIVEVWVGFVDWGFR